MVLHMFEKGFDTMFNINESRPYMDLVQVGKEISYFLEEAHNVTCLKIKNTAFFAR